MEEVDVVVIGAGISGIDAAHHMSVDCPQSSFVVLERRSSHGGTWDLMKYPGIRSDSDMYTFGYNFFPWPKSISIATGGEILEYLDQAIDDSGLRDNIRYDHKIDTAAWDSATARWTVRCENGAAFRCRFLFGCTGYYEADKGHDIEFPGRADFAGKILHPQKWELESQEFQRDGVRGKKVVVVGSGATAVTMIPNLCASVEGPGGGAAHVTMLQRSPTYIMSRVNADPEIEKWLAEPGVDAKEVHERIRVRNLEMGKKMQAAQAERFKKMGVDPSKPEQMQAMMKKMYIGLMKKNLDIGNNPHMSEEEFEKHFTPWYNPWEQRVCFCPDNDFFEVIKRGEASVVTDEIERFDASGIVLKSGEHLDADIIVTATGLHLQENMPMNTMRVSVDGEPYVGSEKVAYMDCMLTDVPNYAFVTGYFQASWTLKADIIAAYVCRVINRITELGPLASCTPRIDPAAHEAIKALPDYAEMPRDALGNLIRKPGVNGPGYALRMRHLQPKRGMDHPWLPLMDPMRDRETLMNADLDDGHLDFTGGSPQLQHRL
jgi:monooxygenase